MEKEAQEFPKLLPLPVQLSEHDLIGHLDSLSSSASPREWKDYPKGFKRHKERNHPGFIRVLIRNHTRKYALVYDPMCGIGTVLKEASRLKRACMGWELRRRFRKIVAKNDPHWLVYHPGDGVVDMVVTSPSYFGMSKSPGKNARSLETAAKVGSAQGTEWSGEEGFEHLDVSMAKTMAEWKVLVFPVVDKIVSVLRQGGWLAWVIKERVKNGQSANFVPDNLEFLSSFHNLKYGGYYTRPLIPTAWQQLGGRKLFLDTGRTGVYGDREYALMFTKR